MQTCDNCKTRYNPQTALRCPACKPGIRFFKEEKITPDKKPSVIQPKDVQRMVDAIAGPETDPARIRAEIYNFLIAEGFDLDTNGRRKQLKKLLLKLCP